METQIALPELSRDVDTYWDESRTCHVVRNVNGEGAIEGWLVKDTVAGVDYAAGNLAQARHRVRFILKNRKGEATA